MTWLTIATIVVLGTFGIICYLAATEVADTVKKRTKVKKRRKKTGK